MHVSCGTDAAHRNMALPLWSRPLLYLPPSGMPSIASYQLATKPAGMPPRNNTSATAQKASGGNISGRGTGGRGGGRGASGRGGRGRGRTGGRGNRQFVKPVKEADLDEGLDECEQTFPEDAADSAGGPRGRDDEPTAMAGTSAPLPHPLLNLGT